MGVSVDKRHHFVSLDLLRGVAAIAVLFLHWFEGNGNTWFHNGLLAVDFFFLLSGFVMAFSYTERLKQGMRFGEFFLLRLIRLYPMILLGIAIGFVRFAMRTLATHDTSMPIPWLLLKALQNVLMIPDISNGLNSDMFILNLAVWSLFFEFIAYILFALGLYKLRDNWLYLIIAVTGVGVWAWMFQEFGPTKAILPFLSFEKYGYVSALTRVLFSFTLGVLVFRIYQRHPIKVSLNGWFMALVLAVFLVMPKEVGEPTISFLIVAFGFPALIMYTASSQLPSKTVPLAKSLGDLSYPLYLVHTPFIWLAGGLFKMVPIARGIPNIWYGAFTIPGAIVLGYVALKFYDEPVRAWLNGLYRQARSKVVQSA